jgi:hypothetical protein
MTRAVALNNIEVLTVNMKLSQEDIALVVGFVTGVKVEVDDGSGKDPFDALTDDQVIAVNRRLRLVNIA